MQVTCFIDYTCPYSYRAMVWLHAVRDAGADLGVSWRTFSLKEAHRDPGTGSAFDDLELSSSSTLALALAHAARGADFHAYNHAVFEAMHGDGQRLDKRALLDIARAAGVDTDTFERDPVPWLRAVAAEHRDAVSRYGVFGTPTLVLAEQGVVFLKLSEVPSIGDQATLWESVCTIARCHPEFLEIKRPVQQ
jgi:predicted DsbA family dithiol-disulfide isomerase